MIAYLNGKLDLITPTHVYMDINGIGYQVNISLNTFEQIKTLKETKLFTHLQVKEDSHTLFGFASEKEKELFLLLISISGIGASTAQTFLSSLSIKEICQAILNGNVVLLNKVKGIGTKTAQRVVLELKDKIAKIEFTNNEMIETTHNSIQLEALSALQTLGFNKNTAEKTVSRILKTQPTIDKVEDLIRLVLNAK